MRYLLLILFTVIVSLTCGAQVSLKDSLLQALQASKEDTAQIKLLINIHNLYASKNYDSFYYYLHKADVLAQKLHTGKFDFFINVGYIEYYYYDNNYQTALRYALKNKDIAEKQNDPKLLAKSYNNLAAVYNHFRNYRSAIEYALKCLQLSEKTKDSTSFPVRNLTASNTYYNLQQYDKTIQYAKKAVEFGKRFNNPFAVGMGLNNMSAAYSGLNMIDSSIMISKQQLQFAKEQEDAVNIYYALINICYEYFKSSNIKALHDYTAELAQNDKAFIDSQTVAETYNVFAMNLIAGQQYNQAKDKLDSGISIAVKTNNPDALGNLYHIYAVLYYLQGKIKEGENYSYKYDSITSAANIKELNFYTEELETKYNTEKKEAQIQLQQVQLNQKNIINYYLITGAAALLVILLLMYRNYRNRQKLQQAKIDELEKEKQLTATEAVLKGEEQERTRLAKDLHDGLGGMLSGIKFSLSNMKENLVMTPDNAQSFERSIDMLDSSIKEMRRVAHNMMPEILVKYGLDTALKEFCSEIDRSGVIDLNYQSIGINGAVLSQSVAVTIYRITQELVNNAIKHAHAKNVVVQLHLYQQEKLLAVTVEDDGNGFDTNLLNHLGGMGWQNIQSRVEFLKGRCDIQSSPGKGTSVMIEINM